MQNIREDKVKRLTNRILKGESKRQAMLKEGYSNYTSRVPKISSTMQKVEKNIREAMLKYDVTTEFVIQGLAKEAKEAGNSSDRISAHAWLGKYLALFTDKSQVEHKTSVPAEDISEDRLKEDIEATLNRIKGQNSVNSQLLK